MNYTRSKRPKNGFTLIATILVVSLLTVLVVAATVVSQIEQQAQYNASRQEVARQNALFGLNQALNQLQTAAGPDRRVTARADILNTLGSALGTVNSGSNEGYSSSTPATDSGQAFWTGVWRNTPNDFSGCAGNGLTVSPDSANKSNPGPGGDYFYYDYLPTGVPNTSATGAFSVPPVVTNRAQLYNNANVQWLVSWPYSTSFTAAPDPTKSLTAQLPSLTLPLRSGTLALSGPNLMVEVASNLNVTSNQVTASSSNIYAPKVPIYSYSPGTNNQIAVGTFAYWVSDEGIKAKTNIPDPYLGNTTVAYNQAHFTASQGNASSTSLIEYSSGSSTYFPNIGTPVDLRTTSFIAPTLAAMGLADSSWLNFEKSPNSYSPDFTVYSYGVLADNYDGGLRQDLTAALENPKIFQYQFSDGTNLEAPRKLYSVDAFLQANDVTDITGGPWSSASTGAILDGMRWSSLYYYYNIYHTTMQSPLVSQTGNCPLQGIGSQFSSECTGASPTITARIYEEPSLGKVVDIDGIMPLLGYWNYVWGIDLNCSSVGSGPPSYTTPYTYNFVTGVSPTMVFMNPFDVSVVNPSTAYYQMKGNIGSFNGSSQPPALEITNASGGIVWGASSLTATAPSSDPTGKLATAFSIAFPDPTIQTELDTIPYSAGEIRTYGLPNKVAAQSAATGSLYSEAETAPTFPATCATFTTASSNRLVPTFSKFSVHNAQEEIVTPESPISIANPTGYSFIATGSHRIGSQSLLLTRSGYYLWPSQTSTGSTSAGNNNIPSFTWSGGGYTNLDSSFGTTLNNNNPDLSLAFVMSFEDHMPGTAVTSFTDHNANLLTHTIGMPMFSAGGPYYNPYNTEFNVYSRDFQNTGRLNTSMYSSSSDLQTVPNSNGTSASFWLPDSVGKSSTSQGRVITFDLPRQPIISLGQFRNMFCRYASNGGGSYSLLGFSAHPLGGSYLAGIPTSEAYLICSGVNSGGYGMPASCLFLDDNFLANSTLFDGYFMSTVPPVGVLDSTNWAIPNASTFGQASIDAGKPLPNSRLVYYNRPQGTYILNPPFSGNPPSTGTNSPNYLDLQCANSPTANIRKPAANLLINGAFNINSTSIPAWTALLLSTSGSSSSGSSNNIMSLFAPNSNATSTSVTTKTFAAGTSPSSSEVPFLNFSLASGPFAWTGTVDNNQAFYGMVDVSNTKVMALAANIVAQVKARGPFLSLGDFLNHRLTAAENSLSTSGALQSAIDALSYNSAIASAAAVGMGTSTAADSTYKDNILYTISNSTIPPTTGSLPAYPPLVDNPPATGTGVPGTLMQGDLVQVLAPVMAARSDTFTIRAYGQAISPTGITEAEAYCEAVLQRVPEYVYSTENGVTDTSGLANYAYDNPSQSTTNTESIGGTQKTVSGLTGGNSAFGRRFKVISIRWLNKNEI